MAVKTSSSISTTTGLGCLFLFGLPFALAGILMDVLLMRAAYEEIRSISWRETPCNISSVEKVVEKSSKSEVIRVKATYRYEVEDQTYTSDRIAAVYDADSIGEFQNRIYNELKQHQETGQRFRCYVNPFNPNDAVLYREANWAQIVLQTLAAVLFSGAGFLMVGLAIVGWFKHRSLRAIAPLENPQPWQTRADWVSGEIRHSNRQLSRGLLIGAGGMAILAIPSMLAGAFEVWEHGTLLALLSLLPMALAGLLLAFGLRARAKWQRFGDSVLQLATVPGVLGGTLAGVVSIEKTVVPPHGFLVNLVCTESRETGSGKNKSTKVTTLWQQDQTIVRDLRGESSEGSNIPILFTLPYGAPETDESTTDGDRSTRTWRLSIRAILPGVDYGASFEVPVFRTEESDPNFVPDPSLIEDYHLPVDSDFPLKNAGLVLEKRDDGFFLGFPRFRELGIAIVMVFIVAIFAVVVTVLCYFFWRMGAPYVGCFMGYLLLMSIADQFFFYSEIEVTPTLLRIRRGSFYLTAPIEIPATEIDRIAIFEAASTSGSTGTTTAHDLNVHLKNGKKQLFAKRIIGKSLADNIIQRIEKTLGLSASS